MAKFNKNKRSKSNKSDSDRPAKSKYSNASKPSEKLVDPQRDRESSNYENPIASRELILQVIHEEGAMLQEDIEARLDLHTDEQLEALRRRLGAMVRDGQLILNRRDGYVPVNEEDLISGRVIAHADGFGFFVPDEGGDDIFLHGRQMKTLLHGDRAVVQITGEDRRGRREGAVINVTERANDRVVGRLFIESGSAFVVADNKRITQDFLIPQDQLGEAKHGQIVIVEITKQPTFKNRAIGRISDVIGDHMAPGMEIDIAIHAHNIPFLWPDEVKQQVASISAKVTEADKKGRTDLTSMPLVTIDGEDARDFDDAVYAEKNGKGWKLFVAIADVSHYVQRDSALDAEAYNRATSVYFPERVIPMLPEVLSNGLCSLNPDVDRLCMVCEMDFDASGKMVGSNFFDAVMHSKARLTYNKVSAMLEDNDQALRKEYSHVLPHLETLYALYHALINQRKKRGSIDFETTETRIIFDDEKRIESIVPTSRNEAHKIIEECMISANIAAAMFLGKHEIPGLYRVHAGPKEEKIDDVRDFILGLGLKFKKGGKVEAQDYARIISQIQDRPDFHLIQTVLLRSLQQAVYSPDNEGHFGLSLENYAHFTSPIRRYPDLLVHRAIRHIIEGKKVSSFFYRHSDMVHLGEHCSANERRADEATRDAVASLKCDFMQSRVGEEFAGTVTSVTGFGIFIELNDIYVEGLVHITNLPKDYYKFEPVTHRLVGERSGETFQLGDAVRVLVAGVNLDDRKIDFDLISHIEQEKPKAQKKIFGNVGSEGERGSEKILDKIKKSKRRNRRGKKKDTVQNNVKQSVIENTSNKVSSNEESKKKALKKKDFNKKSKKPAVKVEELKQVVEKTIAKKDKPKKVEAKKVEAKKVEAKKVEAKKAVVKKATAKKVATKKAPAKKVVVKKTPVKKVAVKKAAIKKPPVKKVVTKKAPAKKVVVKKTPAKKVAVKKATTKKSPVKKVVTKKAPAKKVVVKKTPAKKVAVKKAAVKKVLPKKVAVKKAPAKKVVKKAPAKKVVIKKAAVKKTPAKKVAVKKAPAKKVVVKKAPAKKTPVKKKAVAKKKVSKK